MAEHLLSWQSVLDLDWSLKLDKERSLGVWVKKASPSPMVASDSTSLEAGLWVTKELQGLGFEEASVSFFLSFNSPSTTI